MQDREEQEFKNDNFLDKLSARSERLIRPSTLPFPSGVWTPVGPLGRAALIKFESTTQYTLYACPHTPPADPDLGAVKTTNNVVTLYGRGVFWVYHNTGSTIQGKIIDAAAGAGGVDGIGGAVPTTPSTTTAMTPGAPAVGSVGVASAELLAADAARKQVYLKNTDTTDNISLAFGQAAVLGSGITLYPGEGTMIESKDGAALQIRAIAAAATTPIALQSWT